MDQRPGSSHEDRLRSGSADWAVKSDHAVISPWVAGSDLASASLKSSPTPLPLTETPDSAAMAVASKKKGAAASIKKVPRRARPGGSKRMKNMKTGSAALGVDEASGDEESDNGPYCLCRGPDDHRWMICCERCEDWFHGECINMNKEIGENLIEKFICPNCTAERVATIYKRTCSLGACRKPARLTQSQPSVFCSNEHAQTWWERMVSRLPRARAKNGLSDQLAQDEFVALLNDALSELLSDEEQKFLDEAARARSELAEETLLCHKMFALIELAQERRRAAITAGRFGDDICGYDSRLDAVSARDVFSAFVKSPEGEEVFKNSKLDDPLGEDDAVRGMCERKRCKTHSGWQKMLPSGVKHHIREMAGQAAEVEEEEQIVRRAVAERWRRRQAESNWVESVHE
ncbi:Set1 complex component spp1 [Metarhizium album ARSEF 1941]|uniref:Set1 complex component spp1 n=1 Tax=Metarhizium album (strain ARSEF 1941) TaxID=1081103 RepID=A0A0B2WYP0_METAS|nr:Set1 complex component spp1 [Metarhizium album ARSEF 1941]KHO01387.1 Set1 complex component spp1 [Metarhizium album ARSEF 1941]